MIFVTGCHRSGTSMVASLIKKIFNNQILSPGSEMPPSIDNPRGFNETIELSRINDILIQGFGYKWDRPWLQKPNFGSPRLTESINSLRSFLPHSSTSLWIDKDPRLCLTLDIFSRFFLQDIPTLAVIRNPFMVARSLNLRNGFSIDKSLAIWATYNFCLFSSLNKPLSFVIYDDIAREPKVTASTIIDFVNKLAHINPKYMGIAKEKVDFMEALETLITQTYSPDLNRSAHSNSVLAESLLSKACTNAWLNICAFNEQPTRPDWNGLMKDILSPCIMEVLSNYETIFSCSSHVDYPITLNSLGPQDTDDSDIGSTIYARENQQLQSEIEDLFLTLVRMQDELALERKELSRERHNNFWNQKKLALTNENHKSASSLISRLAQRPK